MRKLGAEFRLPVPRWKGFFEENLDTRFLTTLGLLLLTRPGKRASKISTVNQLKKGAVLRAVLAEI